MARDPLQQIKDENLKGLSHGRYSFYPLHQRYFSRCAPTGAWTAFGSSFVSARLSVVALSLISTTVVLLPSPQVHTH